MSDTEILPALRGENIAIRELLKVRTRDDKRHVRDLRNFPVTTLEAAGEFVRATIATAQLMSTSKMFIICRSGKSIGLYFRRRFRSRGEYAAIVFVGKGVPVPGETDLHKTLKKEGCRWLLKMGYRCIAAEVRLKPLGIIDAVGTGLFRPYHNHLVIPRELPQVCFIECKASRSDFLRDCSNDGQMSLCFLERDQNRLSRGRKRARKLRQSVGLGKFAACLMQPMANLHYVLAPVGMIQKKDLTPRWGLLTYGESGITVTVRAEWQECARTEFVESAIARTLTGDIFRADDRAINSVNRELFCQQTALAERIRTLRSNVILAPGFVAPSGAGE